MLIIFQSNSYTVKFCVILQYTPTPYLNTYFLNDPQSFFSFLRYDSAIKLHNFTLKTTIFCGFSLI
jgi:hypothetical protein